MTVEKLKLRILSGLSNPEYAEREDLIQYAIDEANDIIGSKELADAFYMDIAYYRFIVLVDGATEQDESNYKMALSMLKSASNKTTDPTTGTTSTTVPVRVKVRPNNYE